MNSEYAIAYDFKKVEVYRIKYFQLLSMLETVVQKSNIMIKSTKERIFKLLRLVLRKFCGETKDYLALFSQFWENSSWSLNRRWYQVPLLNIAYGPRIQSSRTRGQFCAFKWILLENNWNIYLWSNSVCLWSTVKNRRFPTTVCKVLLFWTCFQTWELLNHSNKLQWALWKNWSIFKKCNTK